MKYLRHVSKTRTGFTLQVEGSIQPFGFGLDDQIDFEKLKKSVHIGNGTILAVQRPMVRDEYDRSFRHSRSNFLKIGSTALFLRLIIVRPHFPEFSHETSCTWKIPYGI